MTAVVEVAGVVRGHTVVRLTGDITVDRCSRYGQHRAVTLANRVVPERERVVPGWEDLSVDVGFLAEVCLAIGFSTLEFLLTGVHLADLAIGVYDEKLWIPLGLKWSFRLSTVRFALIYNTMLYRFHNSVRRVKNIISDIFWDFLL